MNKKYLWMVAILLVTQLLSACGGMTVGNTSVVFDESCDTGYAVDGEIAGHRCVTDAELKLYQDAAANAFGGSVPMTPIPETEESPAPTPAATSETAAAAAPINFGSCAAPDFSSFVGKPYELIAKLDAQSAKVPQPQSMFTLNAQECTLYWTGAYTGGSWPSGFQPLLVDGQTGVFLIPANNTVSVNFVGAYMPLSQYNAAAQVRVDPGNNPTGCMPAKEVINLLNDHRVNDPERVFRELDAKTNVEGAPFLSARLRPTPDGPQSYTVQNTKAIWWTATGEIEGKTLGILTSLGKTVYLATADGTVKLTGDGHAGAILCETLNPERDITGWK